MPKVRTALSWDDFNNTANDPNGSTVISGTPVSWSFSGPSGNIGTTTNLVTGISTTGGTGPVDNTSSMDLDGTGTGTVTFGAPVTDIQFRINDFEENFETIRVRVYDENNNLVTYTITRGSEVTIVSGSAVSGDVTLGSLTTSGSNSATNPDGSVLFTIAGPASRIVFDVVIGTSASLDLTDIWFTTCFASGTLIRTVQGDRIIDSLKVGDLVETMDHGLKQIRWIGARKLDARTLQARPNLRPICIQAGALGNGTPMADLIVSPQHRVLVRSSIAERMFGSDEVLVAVKHLQKVHLGVEASDQDTVEYFHMLFDDHEIVFSNGAATESLYLGKEALKGIHPEGMAEICAIFPDLNLLLGDPPAPARHLARGAEARQLARRHTKNKKQLMSELVTATVPPA